MEYIEVEVTEGNLKNNHFYLPKDANIFPADAWGGKNAQHAGLPIAVEFHGIDSVANTDIDGTKRMFRSRKPVRIFYESSNVTKNGTLIIVKKSNRRFLVITRSQAERSIFLSTEDSHEADTATKKENARRETKILRTIRESEISKQVKDIYGFRCQVCDRSIQTKLGLYAEGAHIQGLGAPHHGPDIIENMLCLCPNHHVQFDGGGFTINDDFSLKGIEGDLTTNSRHVIDLQYVKYHRENI